MRLIYFVIKLLVQTRIGRWGEKTFPKASNQTIHSHLLREVHDELFNALWDLREVESDRWAENEEVEKASEAAMYELADCFLLLMHIAYKIKRNLFLYAFKKFRINKTRTWGEPDAEGVVEHIR